MKVKLTDDPDVIIDFFCGTKQKRGLLGDFRSALVHQGRRANIEARALGYVNAEHETLAFLVGPLFRAIVDSILVSTDGHTGVCATWRDYAVLLLNQRYDGQVVLDADEEIEGASPPRRREGTKPHNCKEYPPIGGNGHGPLTVLQILKEYDMIIRQEELQRAASTDSYVRDVGDDSPPVYTA